MTYEASARMNRARFGAIPPLASASQTTQKGLISRGFVLGSRPALRTKFPLFAGIQPHPYEISIGSPRQRVLGQLLLPGCPDERGGRGAHNSPAQDEPLT